MTYVALASTFALAIGATVGIVAITADRELRATTVGKLVQVTWCAVLVACGAGLAGLL